VELTVRDLYPEIEAAAIHHLDVGDGHRLYIEESGRLGGIPALFLHGGPGSGIEPFHRRFFDPERYHVILFDQRGSGRSTPHAALEANDTSRLVEDIERIRAFFGIERWLVFGGSWGSTLGLAYAEAHPDRVSALVLRGIFLCRPHEIHWFYQQGASRLFPDYWEDFVEPVPEHRRDEMVRAYYDLLTGDDEILRLKAARAWSAWEGRTATLEPSEAILDHFTDAYVALSLARIECHYFVNNAFLEPDQLLRDAPRLADIPGVIVHGRYDAICPVENAWELHRAWPRSELHIVPGAGHSAAEPGIRAALVEATDALARRLA
jgi:proline iminopeptidase